MNTITTQPRSRTRAERRAIIGQRPMLIGRPPSVEGLT